MRTQLDDYQKGVRAAVGSIAVLCGLCVLASLSGCLTATKLHRWESALLGWGRAGSPVCVDAVKVASKYLADKNHTGASRLNQAEHSALDVALDGEAKKLVTEAAQKCGEVMP